MTISNEMFDELNLLLQFPIDSMMTGIKIHQDAASETIEAARRLFDKGFTTASDGGYLTEAGIALIEHVQIVHSALK
jgi:uncharacterized protein (TIGR02647 family)